MQQYPNRLVVFREKHFNRFFRAETTRQFGKACMKVLQERSEQNWYDWDPLVAKQARAIVNANDLRAAWAFIDKHSDGEYEGYDFEYIEDV